MVSTWRKKQQNRRIFSHLSEAGIEYIIGQSKHGVQTESGDIMLDSGTHLDKANNPAQVNYPKADKHTLEENIDRKVRSEVDSVMTTVENRVQEAF